MNKTLHELQCTRQPKLKCQPEKQGTLPLINKRRCSLDDVSAEMCRAMLAVLIDIAWLWHVREALNAYK